jgi:4-alpha-glucanotransferase
VRIPVKLTPGRPNQRWRLIQEDGEIVEEGVLEITQSASAGPQLADESCSAIVVPQHQLPCGYHRFEIDEATMALIVVPDKCWLEPVEHGQRLWGIAAQLYLLRSVGNWGIGDFTDLGALIDIAVGWGASVIGLNPLHALFLDDPEQASPYSPVSRLYLNVLNIDLTAIPEFSASEDARALLDSHDFVSALNTVRTADKVNYGTVAALKLRTLRLLHRDFVRGADDGRRQALQMFVLERGESLKDYCTFQAIRLELAQNHAVESQPWPEEFRCPASPGTRRFVASHGEDIDFLIWTQWIADEQLHEASRRVSARGLGIGLYRDLAVGSSAEGAETWSNPGIVVAAAHAGAPPDLLNPAGQDWGLPPFNPHTLREAAYAPFIELVRANMRYSGAIRIDHVLGLQHLYWVPAGHPPTHGSYVTYPFEDLVWNSES